MQVGDHHVHALLDDACLILRRTRIHEGIGHDGGEEVSVARRRTRTARLGALAAAFAAIVVAIVSLVERGAPAATRPPTPPASTITSAPSSPTNATSVTFTYSNPQAGVSFRCTLDKSTAECPASGKTYTNVSEGSHTFKVGAFVGTSSLGTVAIRSFTVERKLPTATLTFPTATASLLTADAWSAGCAAGAGICGTAADPSGLVEVTVAVKSTTSGSYWDGSAFASADPVYRTATGTTTWHLPLARPADDDYEVAVVAKDNAGNTTAAAPLTTTFSIDTVAPTTPELGEVPDGLTSRTSARITFALDPDDDPDATRLECKYDFTLYKPCGSPFSIVKLSIARHCFYVRAADEAGNVSEPATRCWTVIIDEGFTIAGTITDQLSLGVSSTVDVSIENPFEFDIELLTLTTQVGAGTTKNGAPNPDCPSLDNFAITQQLDIAGGPRIVVPAQTTKSLSELAVDEDRWPVVEMKSLNVDQTACQGATFHLTYSGTLTSADGVSVPRR